VRTSDVALNNCHPVGRQSTGLVRTDCRRVTHRFAGVQMSHQVVVVHHFLYNSQMRRVVLGNGRKSTQLQSKLSQGSQ